MLALDALGAPKNGKLVRKSGQENLNTALAFVLPVQHRAELQHCGLTIPNGAKDVQM